VTKEVKVRRRAPCAHCRGTGAVAGSSPERCPQCGGRGQVVHSQGFLMISTTCPMCRGEGQVIRSPCPSCEGTGFDQQEDSLQIAIPAGVDGGSPLRLVGRGEAAARRGGRPGNLYVVLRVEADPRFERDGADLHTEIPVSFPQCALGAQVKVPLLDGETDVTVPAGSQPGETVVLRGKGLPRLDDHGTGDLIAHLKLVVPAALTEEQERLLRAFSEAGGAAVPAPEPERKGFFGRRRKR
jgi:molecular chaperone DnaJ